VTTCCSAEAAACAADANCVCWRDCMVANNDAGICFNTCQAPGATTMAYGMCGTTNCDPQCPQFGN
jgi:hypothetical protein